MDFLVLRLPPPSHRRTKGLLEWFWETNTQLRSCTICTVWNQEAYAQNISVNWVFTLFAYLRIKNTHSLFMTTVFCRCSVGCLCVQAFTWQSCDSALISCFFSPLLFAAWFKCIQKSRCIKFCNCSERSTFTLWGMELKQAVLIMLSFRALAYSSLQALATVMHSVSNRAICDE